MFVNTVEHTRLISFWLKLVILGFLKSFAVLQ